MEGEDQSRTEPQKRSPFLGLPSGLSPPHTRRLFQSTLSEQGGKGVQRRWGGGSVGEKSGSWLHSRPIALRLRCAEAHEPDSLGQWGLLWELVKFVNV